jgi:hypothetical protein
LVLHENQGVFAFDYQFDLQAEKVRRRVPFGSRLR